MALSKTQSSKKTQALDIKIENAIRQVYGTGEEGDEIMEHFFNTIDDAESYFGYNNEYRDETMYSGDFEYRNEH